MALHGSENEGGGLPRPWYFVAAVLGVIVFLAMLIPLLSGQSKQQLENAKTVLFLAFGYGLLVIGFFAGMLVLWNMAMGSIDLSQLLCDDKGLASMSRFQLFIFTFVVAFSYFFIAAQKGDLPAIPTEVLTLLGISATTYGVGKAIDQSTPEPPKDGQGPEQE